MSILQFLRVVWAGRFITAITTTVCFVAAILTVQMVKPRYQADTRVMLDVIKPDPVTGQVMATAFLKAFTKTQIELLQGENVALAVVEDLGWAENKRIIAAYKARDKRDNSDFTHWAAQRVINGTDARVIDGSNILEITYKSSDPNTAKVVADSLSKAYMATTLQSRQEAARRNADWYDTQAAKAQSALFQAETAKSNYERENGVLLQDDKQDIDSARLQALAQSSIAPSMAMAPAAAAGGSGSGTGMQLAQLDADIAQASKTLGPNNPQLIEMRRRREVLAQQVQQERAMAGNTVAATMSAARANAALLEAQKSKVLGQRDKVERLRLLQDDVDLRRDEYNKAAQRAAQLRQEADVADSGVTPLGAAVTPRNPVFPNKPLVVGGGLAGGLGLGLGVTILLELIGRKIRGPEDLRAAINAPLLATISNPILHRRRRLSFGQRMAAMFRKTAPA